jgi:hypothetical protein
LHSWKRCLFSLSCRCYLRLCPRISRKFQKFPLPNR